MRRPSEATTAQEHSALSAGLRPRTGDLGAATSLVLTPHLQGLRCTLCYPSLCHLTSSELNNNLGIATDLGLRPFHVH